jgi:PTH1 family peptidyl-tRNA hydrolase
VKIVVGLGNPGQEYSITRHNLGFMVADRLASIHSFPVSRKKFKSKIALGSISGKEVLLVKPQTFMNLSGEAVGRLVRFYKRPLSDLLVVYDDVDIPFGAIRLRPSGGAAGHKGMESIIDNLGSDEFPRLRIGIRGSEPRGDLSKYVLRRFTPEEKDSLNEIIDKSCNAVEAALTESFEAAMNRFN